MPFDERYKADWIWDEELNMHIPACSQLIWWPTKGFTKCGKGPLSGDKLISGDCGTRHQQKPKKAI